MDPFKFVRTLPYATFSSTEMEKELDYASKKTDPEKHRAKIREKHVKKPRFTLKNKIFHGHHRGRDEVGKRVRRRGYKMAKVNFNKSFTSGFGRPKAIQR